MGAQYADEKMKELIMIIKGILSIPRMDSLSTKLKTSALWLLKTVFYALFSFYLDSYCSSRSWAEPFSWVFYDNFDLWWINGSLEIFSYFHRLFYAEMPFLKLDVLLFLILVFCVLITAMIWVRLVTNIGKCLDRLTIKMILLFFYLLNNGFSNYWCLWQLFFQSEISLILFLLIARVHFCLYEAELSQNSDKTEKWSIGDARHKEESTTTSYFLSFLII